MTSLSTQRQDSYVGEGCCRDAQVLETMSSMEKAAQAHDAALYLLVPISLSSQNNFAVHTNIHTVWVSYMSSPTIADASERKWKLTQAAYSINRLAITRQESTASG